MTYILCQLAYQVFTGVTEKRNEKGDYIIVPDK